MPLSNCIGAQYINSCYKLVPASGNETKHEVGSILSMSLISNLMNIPANGLRLGGHKMLICVRGGVIDQTGPYVLSCRRSVGPSQGIRLPL